MREMISCCCGWRSEFTSRHCASPCGAVARRRGALAGFPRRSCCSFTWERNSPPRSTRANPRLGRPRDRHELDRLPGHAVRRRAGGEQAARGCGAGVLEDGNGRSRLRSDAAEFHRHLRDAQAAVAMARSEAAQGRTPQAARCGVQAAPGKNYSYSQPIQMRFNELLGGVPAT